jgi:hypothetical protein
MSSAMCQCISFADDAKARCSQAVNKSMHRDLSSEDALEDADKIQAFQSILSKAMYEGQFCSVHYALSRPLYHRYKRSSEVALLSIDGWFGLKWTQNAVDNACATTESFEQHVRPVEILSQHGLLQSPGVAVDTFKKLYHRICKARDERARFAEALVFPACRDQGHKIFSSLFDRYVKLCEQTLRWMFGHLQVPTTTATNEPQAGSIADATSATASVSIAALPPASRFSSSSSAQPDVDAILRAAGEDVRREIDEQDALVNAIVRDDLVRMFQRFFVRRRDAMIREDKKQAAATGREHDASMFVMQHLNYHLEFYQLLFRDMRDVLLGELESQAKKLGRRKLKKAFEHHQPLRQMLNCVKVLATTLPIALDLYLEVIQRDADQTLEMWIDIDRVILMALAAYEPSHESISLLRAHLVDGEFQQQMDTRADTWSMRASVESDVLSTADTQGKMFRAADIVDPASSQATQIIDLQPVLRELWARVKDVDLDADEVVEESQALPEWCLTIADCRRLLKPVLLQTRLALTRIAFRRAMWCVRHALNQLKPTGATVQVLHFPRRFAFQRDPRKRPFQTMPTNTFASVLIYSIPDDVMVSLDSRDMQQWLTAEDDPAHVSRNVNLREVLATASLYQTHS